ncbi:hypothetical protein D3C85_858410 [compost metagenome]
MAAHGLVDAIAVELLAGVVPVDRPALAVVALHGDARRLLEQLAETLLAFAQCLFVALLSTDVLHGAEGAAVGLGFAAQGQPDRLLVVGPVQPRVHGQRAALCEQRLQAALHAHAVRRVKTVQQTFQAVLRAAFEDALRARAPGEAPVILPVAEGGVALRLVQLQAGTPQPPAQVLAAQAVAAFEKEDQQAAEQDQAAHA